MDKEKTEQIKIALLGVIALLLIIETVMTHSSTVDDSTPRLDRNGTPQAVINDMGGITVNTNPGAQVVPQLTPQPAPQPAKQVTSMTFDKADVDLGTVALSEGKTHTYSVTNTGTIDLNFDKITADQGVQIVSRPNSPIPPGGTGEITVQLTAEVGTGPIKKTIHVTSNTEPSHMHLTVAAEVQ